ncbi:GspE/PulE family protein [Candidatus Odyssella thessalonicensis]|uniref:GspE/PulE family protein n=1 Tax=Candidatus Odyssella thessalonicensis TaxID=84647 RepID=UPI000225AEEE|nr:GspE/PulE family protein [Candidatus Odyssella thessalonicensis]
MPLLGELLIEKRLIQQDHLDTALREQRRSRRFLGEILLTLGFIKSEDLYPVLAAQMEIPFIDLSACSDCHYHPNGWVYIVNDLEDYLQIAVSDPQDLFLQRKLAQTYPDQSLKLYLCDPKAMDQLNYQITATTQAQDYAPDLLRDLISQALENRTSDIHFVPASHHCQILLRIDGALVAFRTLHNEQWQALRAHIKVLSHLDLAQTRRPQDGAFRFLKRSDPIDCRVSTLPTKDGESIVIRLLDPRSVLLGLDHLGLPDNQLAKLQKIAQLPDGLFIITGPTGSGKTTTLYSLLQEIMPSGRNIMTVEQPIEYRLEGLRQTEIQENVISFAETLRSILRHDPDVIYISEIRDEETAMTAVRAAMTGHLVLTTLHVSNVRLIEHRLKDLGVPPSYLAGVLKGAMAQRLLRLKCPDCLGEGCSSCLSTGYYGRHVVAEVFVEGDDLEQQYHHHPSERMTSYAYSLVDHELTDQNEITRVFGLIGTEGDQNAA